MSEVPNLDVEQPEPMYDDVDDRPAMRIGQHLQVFGDIEGYDAKEFENVAIPNGAQVTIVSIPSIDPLVDYQGRRPFIDFAAVDARRRGYPRSQT